MKSLLFGSAVLGVCLTTAGCGGGAGDYPDMGTVHGTVRMDGNPLPEAVVVFTPQGGTGRPSFGRTDSDGYYELTYSVNMEGAKTGKHAVSISTRKTGNPNDPEEKASPETVPNKYNSQTELTADVTTGSNEIDFDISSEGEIDKAESSSYEDGDQ